MRIAYVRVSTVEQNDERQVNALEKYEIEKWFCEKISAKNIDRPQLQEMLQFVRAGDIIYILDFSRIARSTKDLLSITDDLTARGVKLVSVKENIDTQTPSGRLMLTMIGAIAEFERKNMLERQREGIAIAKADGKYKGGQPKQIDKEKFSEQYTLYKAREITKTKMAENLGVSRPTLNKWINNPDIILSDDKGHEVIFECMRYKRDV